MEVVEDQNIRTRRSRVANGFNGIPAIGGTFSNELVLRLPIEAVGPRYGMFGAPVLMK